VGHGEGLAGAGCAHQGLKWFSVERAAREFLDGGGLIALRLEGADDLEIGHMNSLEVLRR